jgi:hypothetical protein
MRIFAGVMFLGGLLAMTSLSSAQPPGGFGKGGQRGKGDDKGKGFPGRPGGGGFGFGAMQPGQILPAAVAERLKLNDDQKKQLESLQKDVDEKLAKILNEDQNKQLKEMKERSSRGFGRPDGERGPPRRPGGDKGPPPPPEE